MGTFSRHDINTISWIDLAATDFDRQTAFYQQLMGWDLPAYDDGPYRVFTMGDVAVGGVMPMTPEMGNMPTVWSVYVCVNDADAVLAEATNLGGSIAQEPFEITDGGRIAVLLDPSGAAICLFEGGAEMGLGAIDEVGAPCWFDCRSRDAAGSVKFYEALFGWTSEAMDGPMDYHVMAHEGRPLCGVLQMTEDVFPPAVPSHWAVSLSVADADAAVAVATEAGGQLMGPVMDTPYGRTANLVDPEGAGFMIIDRSTATAG